MMAKPDDESNFPAMLLTFAILAVLVALWLCGCAEIPVEVGDVKQSVAAEFAALKAEFAAELAVIKGDVAVFQGNLGGGGDTITSVLLAAGVLVSSYPGGRLVRRFLERRRERRQGQTACR